MRQSIVFPINLHPSAPADWLIATCDVERHHDAKKVSTET
jgi:hypothetical protein